MLIMRDRRGLTLIELLVVIIMLGIVSVSVSQVVIGSLRISRSQMIQADLQSNVRTGGLVVPLELREIGYDSSVFTNAVSSDVEAIGTDWVQFRAMRGIGYTCGTPALTEFRIRKPPQGFRDPLMTDGFMLFVESDKNIGIDDQWAPLIVTAIDYNSTCGADSAIALTVLPPSLAALVPVQLSMVFVGGPIRYYERMRFGAFVDADGLTYMGARSVSLGELAYRAVAGPLHADNPIRFRYYNRAGVQVAPGAVNPVEVRTIDIELRGITRDSVNLAGSLARRTGAMTVQTRVALRNTLRH